jgi:hypothetical protein
MVTGHFRDQSPKGALTHEAVSLALLVEVGRYPEKAVDHLAFAGNLPAGGKYPGAGN